jgi:hypothetical protein
MVALLTLTLESLEQGQNRDHGMFSLTPHPHFQDYLLASCKTESDCQRWATQVKSGDLT